MLINNLDVRIFDFLKVYFSKRLSISDSTLKAMADASEMVYLTKNSCLQRAGVRPTYLYFLIDGIVREHVDQDEGARFNLTFRYAPDTFGAVSSIRNNANAPYSISAVTDCYVSRMAGDDFFDILKSHPDLLKLLLVENESHYLKLFQRLKHLIEKDIKGSLNGKGELPLNVVQKIPGYQLASYFGITPESLSRIKAKIKCESKAKESV
ncbi:MAG: Crp/Fnr family transcriptional regulator [Cellvibrionaceae bacterium]